MSALLLGFHFTAFSFQLLAAAPDADTAVAVAVGLARSGGPPVEVPVNVEVTRPEPSTKAGRQTPGVGQIEWVPTCDQHGCRLAPRVVPPDTPRATARASQHATADSAPAPATSASYSDGRCPYPRRRIFGRRP